MYHLLPPTLRLAYTCLCKSELGGIHAQACLDPIECVEYLVYVLVLELREMDSAAVVLHDTRELSMKVEQVVRIGMANYRCA